MMSISLALIACQPRILEPSKPCPSANSPSLSSPIGTLRCCHRPGKSINRRSRILAPLFLANAITSVGVMLSFLLYLIHALRMRRSPQWALASDGLFTALSCTNADDLLHGGNEDLPISNAASLGCSHNRFNDHVFQVVRDDYFYLGFGEKVNDIFGTTIELGMAA